MHCKIKHSYIIGHYNPPVRVIDLVSHTTCVVCYRFFLRNLFMEILFTLRVLARNLLRGNRRRNTFRILFFMSGLGPESWLFV